MNGKTRKAVLERDGHECQLSKLFGITELSGKPCSEDLELHHITYERYGRESISDLIVVCTRCHDILTDAIRRERYATRRTSLKDGQSVTGLCPGSGRKGKTNEQELEVSRLSRNGKRQPTIGCLWGYWYLVLPAAPRLAMPCPAKPGPAMPHLVNEL